MQLGKSDEELKNQQLIENLIESTTKSRTNVIKTLKSVGWDANRAFESLMKEEVKEEPPKTQKYKVMKHEEKMALKKIQEDLFISQQLLTSVIVKKKLIFSYDGHYKEKGTDSKEEFYKKLRGESRMEKKKIPIWSYKVFPKDNNYSQRSDLVNDFFDYDPDQCFQIENHYQSCLDGSIQFGVKYTIVGDQFKKKSGNLYNVWGNSADPSTWFE